MKNNVTELVGKHHQHTPTIIADALAEVEDPDVTEVQRGINIDFLWVPTELAREKRPGLDWTVKILVALSGMGARKPAGYKGLLATDEELADFLQLSSPRQVQKAIVRGINTGLLERPEGHQRLLVGYTPDKSTTGIKIAHDVLVHPNLTWVQKALYSLIAGMVKGKRHRCYASNAWFGKYMGLSEGYIREMIAELAQGDFISSKCHKRRRYLSVTGSLPSPTVAGNKVIDIALEPHPDSPGAAPSRGLNSPVATPIRFYNIKDSKEISLAEPENFSFGRTEESKQCLNDIDDTSTTNRVENAVITQQHDNISQTSDSNTSRWNPANDFEWQYKQFLTTIKGMFLQMQISQVISRSRSLTIDDVALRDFCIQSLGGKLIAIDAYCGRLLFTAEASEFLEYLSLSWFGMKLLQNETEKFNVWLITKNTNDISKFIKRYPAIKNQLKKQTDYIKQVGVIVQPVLEGMLFNWLRHGWSTRWNPAGNVLFTDIPDEILDYQRLQHAREKFDYHVQSAREEYSAHRSKPVPELLQEGINRCWTTHFAWVMLHNMGLHTHADQYEVVVLDAFKVEPEILEAYRERMPGVMNKVKTWIVQRN